MGTVIRLCMICPIMTSCILSFILVCILLNYILCPFPFYINLFHFHFDLFNSISILFFCFLEYLYIIMLQLEFLHCSMSNNCNKSYVVLFPQLPWLCFSRWPLLRAECVRFPAAKQMYWPLLIVFFWSEGSVCTGGAHLVAVINGVIFFLSPGL